MSVRPASRGDDGRTYGLITFAILTVAALGAFFWQKFSINDDLVRRAETAEKRNKQFGNPPSYYSDEATGRGGATVADVMNQSIQDMAHLVTGKKDALWPGVKDESDRVLKQLAKDTGGKVAENDTLLTALSKLGSAYQKLAADRADLQSKYDEKNAESDNIAQGSAMARKEYEEQINALKADVERIEQEKNDAIAAKDKQFTDQQSIGESQTEELNRQRVETQRSNREHEIVVDKQQKQIDDLQKSIAGLRSTGFDPTDILRKADGRVLRAIPGSDVVYIDIGSKDRVRAGMTFAVFSPVGERASGDTSKSLDVSGKASVEVQAVRDGTSECRIIRQTPGKPIIEGDVAVNIAFERDRKTRFVIRGEFDLNYDGEIDWDGVEKISAIIREWGGQVVKDVDESVDFVVIGVGPQSPRAVDNRPVSAVVQDLMSSKKAERADWEAVIEKARARNIPVITQTQFLYLTGTSISSLASR